MRVAQAIEPDAQTERELRALSKGRRVEARVQQRARVILLAAEGWQNKDIAEEVKLDRRQVALWRQRFLDGGLQALLQDAMRSGRTPSVSSAVESHILSTTLNEQPATALQWSTRSLASHLGLSATTIRRVWQRNGIQPHLPDSPTASRDRARAADMQVDVLALYMGPRERVLVLGCDDTDAARGAHRPRAARTGVAPQDLARMSTATLITSLKALEGTVVSRYPAPPRDETWLAFLRTVARQAPGHGRLHLVMAHPASVRHPDVQAWLARHPDWLVRCGPAGVSWLNTVRRQMRDLLRHPIGSHSFASLAELQQAMAQFIEPQRGKTRPFAWTASALETTKTAGRLRR